MAVADATSAAPPAPEDCTHPQPVTGVLAHEFAHYDGAIGPEGRRRTVTYYGPVIGGLPISAWHCEVCGLLRLTYPDGRTEERRLFPGPQPGLLAAPSAIAPESVEYGRQARVSGLSASPSFIQQLIEEQGLLQRPLQLPRVTLPDWDAITWLLVGGLVSVIVALLIAGFLAVYTFSTPDAELPLVIVTTLLFVALLVFRLGVAAVRHFFPAQPLRPSIATAARGKPALDGTTRTVIALLVLSLTGLFAAGVLAVYTFVTPGAEGPVFVASMACAVAAIVIKLVDVVWRHFSGR